MIGLVLLGAPGAGKGTQASKIEEKYGLLHISTGDIFRDNIKNDTPIGRKAKSYMDAGKLVPDDVTCELVEDRLKGFDGKGYMLDGFPRNLFQAERLDEFASIDLCININVDTALLTDRICGRRVCRECGESYHISMLGGATTCKKCGGQLYQRDDDNEDTVKARLATYFEQTAPLVDFYRQSHRLFTVQSGEGSPDEVFVQIEKKLDEILK